MDLQKIQWKAAAAGAAAGLAGGLFGAGGGMLLVPLLRGGCSVDERRAFATALCVMAPLCLVSLGVYAVQGDLAWAESIPYLIGGTCGGLLGARLLRRAPVRLLHAILGGLILWGAVRQWR